MYTKTMEKEEGSWGLIRIQKVTVIIDNCEKNKYRKLILKPVHQEASLSTILAQFPATLVKFRLPFLS
jgi:hypothetical protein